MSILLPLRIEKGQLARAKNTKEAIDTFIELLLATPCQSCVADRQFGFVFNNLKFEIFNENEGVIYNSAIGDEDPGLYDKKVSGSSKSVNTFAIELKKAIETYEKRLTNVSVMMSYIKNLKKYMSTSRERSWKQTRLTNTRPASTSGTDTLPHDIKH